LGEKNWFGVSGDCSLKDNDCDYRMSTDYFIKLCTKAKIPVPSKDADVRTLLSDAGATVLDAKTAAATKLRKEHAAAVLWARANLEKDGSWKKFPDEARDTIIALFPIKQSVIDKGGTAWTAPCRALIRVYASPPASPKNPRKSRQVNKGSRSDEGSEPMSDSSSSDEQEPPKKKAKVPEKRAESGKKGPKDAVTPYLPTPALLAILPTHRRFCRPMSGYKGRKDYSATFVSCKPLRVRVDSRVRRGRIVFSPSVSRALGLHPCPTHFYEVGG